MSEKTFRVKMEEQRAEQFRGLIQEELKRQTKSGDRATSLKNFAARAGIPYWKLLRAKGLDKERDQIRRNCETDLMQTFDNYRDKVLSGRVQPPTSLREICTACKVSSSRPHTSTDPRFLDMSRQLIAKYSGEGLAVRCESEDHRARLRQRNYQSYRIARHQYHMKLKAEKEPTDA